MVSMLDFGVCKTGSRQALEAAAHSPFLLPIVFVSIPVSRHLGSTHMHARSLSHAGTHARAGLQLGVLQAAMVPSPQGAGEYVVSSCFDAVQPKQCTMLSDELGMFEQQWTIFAKNMQALIRARTRPRCVSMSRHVKLMHVFVPAGAKHPEGWLHSRLAAPPQRCCQ